MPVPSTLTATLLSAGSLPADGNLVGPTCGLPSAVTTMASMFVGWEKGFLAIVVIVGLFACLIMWGIGTAFNWRHVEEAGQKGLLVLLMIAGAAAVITGMAAAVLAYLHC